MSKWIPAWRSVPIDYNYEVATFENITQNCLMINNLRGEQMRIRFNNLYSNSPIAIDYVTVSLSNRVTGRAARCGWAPSLPSVGLASSGGRRRRCFVAGTMS